MWKRRKIFPVLTQVSTLTAKGGIYNGSHWQMWHGTHYHPQRFVVHLPRPPRSPVELEGHPHVFHFRRASHIAPYGTPEKAIIQSLEQFVLVLAIDSVLIFEAMLVCEPCCLLRPSACRSPTGAGSPRWRGGISAMKSRRICSSCHQTTPRSLRPARKRSLLP